MDQVFGLMVGGQNLAQFGGGFTLFRRGDFAGQTADRIQDVNGRVMSHGAELAGQNNVAVQDGTRGVADGFVKVVAFHQHSEKSSDGGLGVVSGAFKNLGQHLEDAGRVALLAGRLAGGQSDFPLRHREPGDRIHHQKHGLALIAEILRHGECGEAGADAQRRGHIRGRHDDNTAGQSFRAELLFEELAHFSVAFADHRDDADIGRVVAGHGAEQRALSNTRAAENAHTLAFADGEQAVDGADSGDQCLGNRHPFERPGRGGEQVIAILRFDGRSSVQRPAESIQHAPQQTGPDLQERGIRPGGHRVTGLQASGFLQRHQQDAIFAKPHHLRAEVAPVLQVDLTDISEGGGRAFGGDQQAYQFPNTSGPAPRLDRV